MTDPSAELAGAPIDLRGHRLVLASASPRRADLLRSVGLRFDVVPADLDETRRQTESPTDYVTRLSQEKAAAIAAHVDDPALVLAADTTVDLGGEILEKPIDDADARRMLQLLSGRTHLVHTGVTVVSSGFRQTRAGEASAKGTSIVVETAVTFVELTDATIEWYLATGEHADKAGAYAIQGAAGALVARVDGSVTNVIGLPLAETLELLNGR